MKQIVVILVLFGLLYAAYTMFLGDFANDTQKQIEKTGRIYVTSPEKIRESIKRDDTGRTPSEWSPLYKTSGVVISISPGAVVIEEEGGVRNRFRVSEGVSLGGISEGDAVLFRRSGYDLVEISPLER